jgi:hypothetical protein
LWIGTSLGSFGQQVAYVAVLQQTWELTRSPLWTGTIGIATAVPVIVFGLPGGSLADAVDRRSLVGDRSSPTSPVAGAADSISVFIRGALVQLESPDEYRGRVSSVELVIGHVGPEIGNFRGGLVASPTSAPIALITGGLAATAVTVAVGRALVLF